MQAGQLPAAKKRFGQNFLVQPAMVQRLVAAIAPRPTDCLIEIGPGPGALTQALLAVRPEGSPPLTVVELDRDLLPGLHALAPPSRLQVVAGDALKVDFGAFASPGQALRIVGNLPYNISTPLIFHLLQWSAQIEDLHFMLQKEVVDRMVARPGSKAYGRLSVMVQSLCQAESLFTVAPGNFFPVPKVDSAFVRLRPVRPARLPEPLRLVFARAVSLAFAQRRKTLANNFKGVLTADALRALDLDPGARAETLDFDAFYRLAEALKQGDGV